MKIQEVRYNPSDTLSPYTVIMDSMARYEDEIPNPPYQDAIIFNEESDFNWCWVNPANDYGRKIPFSHLPRTSQAIVKKQMLMANHTRLEKLVNQYAGGFIDLSKYIINLTKEQDKVTNVCHTENAVLREVLKKGIKNAESDLASL